MAKKCKKGEVWDSRIEDCRVSTSREKRRMKQWEGAKEAASSFGTMTGAAAGSVVGSVAGRGVKSEKSKALSLLAGTVGGALIGRYKAIKKQREKSSPPYTNVPSRKIPRGKKRKRKK